MKESTALRGMATISFWADDIKAARKWYTELLGRAWNYRSEIRTEGSAKRNGRRGSLLARGRHQRNVGKTFVNGMQGIWTAHTSRGRLHYRVRCRSIRKYSWNNVQSTLSGNGRIQKQGRLYKVTLSLLPIAVSAVLNPCPSYRLPRQDFRLTFPAQNCL